MASLNLITTFSGQPIFQLPPTSTIVGSVVVAKDTSQTLTFSTLLISTTFPDLFEDYNNTKLITNPQGYASFVAGDDLKWYCLQNTQETQIITETLQVSALIDATPSYSIQKLF